MVHVEYTHVCSYTCLCVHAEGCRSMSIVSLSHSLPCILRQYLSLSFELADTLTGWWASEILLPLVPVPTTLGYRLYSWGLGSPKIRSSWLYSKYFTHWPIIPAMIGDFVVILFFIFLRDPILFSILAIEIYLTTNSIKGIKFTLLLTV